MDTQHSILIVDDEEALVRVLSQKFSDEGIRVYTAANGKEALATALKVHPDVILLDLMMPEMDGYEMMEELQRDTWGKTVPVLILTNSSSIDTVERVVRTNMSEFMVKTDLRLNDIVDRVKRYFA